MRIALIGYGKMGKMVEQSAVSHGHTITARITSQNWDIHALDDADLCVEFTRPECAIENIKRAAECKKSIVVGTTGWYEKIDDVSSLVASNQIGLLYGPNFSVGVHIWLETLSRASSLINHFEEYEAAGIEQHHSQKRDSPSGTAIAMAKTVEAEIDRLKALPISSIRCGHIPGTHSLIFDSPSDTISITHSTRNREGLASGAILAAEWLLGKKGIYSFNDCMKDFINQRLR